MSEIQVGQINSTDGSTAITTGAGGTVELSAALTGTDATLSGGVYLGGTGAANYLDDYEEGTWTPSLLLYNGTPTITNSFYTKVGRVVTAVCTIELDGTSDGSHFRVSGLPFTSANIGNGNSYQGGFIAYTNSAFHPMYILMGTNSTTWEIYQDSGGQVTYLDIGLSSNIRVEIIYFAA